MEINKAVKEVKEEKTNINMTNEELNKGRIAGVDYYYTNHKDKVEKETAIKIDALLLTDDLLLVRSFAGSIKTTSGIHLQNSVNGTNRLAEIIKMPPTVNPSFAISSLLKVGTVVVFDTETPMVPVEGIIGARLKLINAAYVVAVLNDEFSKELTDFEKETSK